VSRLWTDLVTDSLTEYAYDAEIAGLNYSLSSDQRGVFIVLSGYNDKLHVLARRVLERIKQLDVKSDRLVVVKENVKRNWQNFFLGKPYEISNYFGTWLLNEKQWLVQEKLAEIDSKLLISSRTSRRCSCISDITPEDITKHISQFLADTYSDVLVVGNLDKEVCSGVK
jgi:insulysin